MTLTDQLTASLEDYLETIFLIIEEKQAVMPRDIARRLKVSNASVTGALRALADKGLINYAPYDVISLTPNGKTTAMDISRRHEVLRDFFVNILAVDEPDADKAACDMEHAISRPVLDRFVLFAEFTDTCPRGGSGWISGFIHYCENGDIRDNCDECVSETLRQLRQRRKTKGRKGTVATRLIDLKPGRKGRVLNAGRGPAGKRIEEMGLTPGAVVELESNDSPDESIHVKVKGYHRSLQRYEAERVTVETLPAAVESG